MLGNIRAKAFCAAVATSVVCMLGTAAHAETLQQVFDLARQNDALLKSQAAQAAAGKETGNIYKAQLLPQASLQGTFARSNKDIHGMSCSPTIPNGCNNTEAGVKKGSLNVAQNLLNLEAWYDFKRGKKIAEQSDAVYRANEQDLILRVTQAYVNVLRSVDTYKTARAQEDAIARQLEQAKQRFDVGLIAITDVQESQATFDSAHVQTLSAQGNIGIAFEALEALTGQPITTIAPFADEMPVRLPEPQQQAAWEKLALENNPLLAASQLAAEAARDNAKARRAAHLPTIMGSYQYSDSNTSVDYTDNATVPLLHDIDRGNTVALSVNIPLYSGGGTSARQRQAYAQQMAAEDTLTDNRRNLVQNARSLHLAVRTDVERVSAQKQAIVSAKSALDATQAGYEVGTRNIVDVLDAQQRLYQARLAHANARYQFILDTMRLMQTAGTLDAENIQKLNNFAQADKNFTRASFGE
jgi:outer membrane protein